MKKDSKYPRKRTKLVFEIETIRELDLRAVVGGRTRGTTTETQISSCPCCTEM